MCHFCVSGQRDIHLEDLAPIPPPARQPGGNAQPAEIMMNGQDIRAYVQAVADYLHKKRISITVVGVGGVLSTMVLGTRRATHDVDIFCDSISPDQAKYLRKAIQKAAKKHSLSEDWLNNRTVLHIPHGLRRLIQQDAIRQNCIIFDSPGLRMVAAPWMYSFTSKLHRLSGSGAGAARVYDPADAANFLMQYLRSQNRRTMPASEVRAWINRYGILITDARLGPALEATNAAARQQIIVAG